MEKQLKKEFYSVEEVALRLNLDASRVYYLIRTGVVSGEKRRKSPLSTAKVWKVPHDEVLRFENLMELKSEGYALHHSYFL